MLDVPNPTLTALTLEKFATLVTMQIQLLKQSVYENSHQRKPVRVPSIFCGPPSLSRPCVQAHTHEHVPFLSYFPSPTHHLLLLIAQVCGQLTVSNINDWEVKVVPYNNIILTPLHSDMLPGESHGGTAK